MKNFVLRTIAAIALLTLFVMSGFTGLNLLFASSAQAQKSSFEDELEKSLIAKDQGCLKTAQNKSVCLFGLEFFKDPKLLKYKDWQSVLKGIANHCTSRYNFEVAKTLSKKLGPLKKVVDQMANLCLSFTAAFVPEINCSQKFTKDGYGFTLNSVCEQSALIANKAATNFQVKQLEFDVSESFISFMLKKMREECESITDGYLDRWLCVKNVHRLFTIQKNTNFYSARRIRAEICGAPLKPTKTTSCIDKTSEKIKLAEIQDKAILEKYKSDIYQMARNEYNSSLLGPKVEGKRPSTSDKEGNSISSYLQAQVGKYVAKFKAFLTKFRDPLMSISDPRLLLAKTKSHLNHHPEEFVGPQLPDDLYRTLVLPSGYEFVFDIKDYCNSNEPDECEESLPPIRYIKNNNKNGKNLYFSKDLDRETSNICSLVITDKTNWKCLSPRDKQVQWNEYYESMAKEREKFVNQISSQAIEDLMVTEIDKVKSVHERFGNKLSKVVPYLMEGSHLRKSDLFTLRRALKAMPMGMVIPYNPNEDVPLDLSDDSARPISSEKYAEQLAQIWTKVKNGKKLNKVEEAYLVRVLMRVQNKTLRFMEAFEKVMKLNEQQQIQQQMEQQPMEELQQNEKQQDQNNQEESPVPNNSSGEPEEEDFDIPLPPS